MRANILVYAFIISVALHLLLFVPWMSPQKIEKKRETIPVTYRTIARKETQPPAPEKAKDKPKRSRGLPQPTSLAANTLPPTPPTPPLPKPPPKPQVAKQPAPFPQKSTPPPPLPPPEPKPTPKIEPVKPKQEEAPAPVTKKLAPLKEAKEPPKQQVVEKKVTEPSVKPAEVKKEAPKEKTKKAKKPVKRRVAKKPPRKQKTSKTPKKTVARKATPEKQEAPVKKYLPTLQELLPPLMGSGLEPGSVATGSHGNEYISMDSRDPRYSSWLASLQRDIYRTWLPTYPRGNIRGEVLLGLMIRNDGHLDYVEVLRTSGLELLDRHAVEAVRAAAPFERFPPWMTQERQGIKATFTYGGTPGTVRSWNR
jgi:TonB family protein